MDLNKHLTRFKKGIELLLITAFACAAVYCVSVMLSFGDLWMIVHYPRFYNGMWVGIFIAVVAYLVGWFVDKGN